MKTLSLLIFLCIMINFPMKSQWEEQATPTTNPLYSVSVVDNSVAWICGRYGTILKTTNGGVNWDIIANGVFQSYVHFFSVYALNDQVAFIAYHQGGIGETTNIFKTTDAGQNWSAVFQQTGGAVIDIRMFTPNTGFMYTSPLNQYWRFFSTLDGGSSWTQISVFQEQGLVESGHYNSTFISGSDIFFGSNTGFIYHSSDAGYNWSVHATTQTNSYAIWFNNSSDGLAGGESAMEMTTDGGSSWSILTSLGNVDSASGITGTNNDWWISSQDKIYYSNNNRVSWITQYTSPSGKYNQMSKARSGNLIIAVRNDGGISAYMAPVPVELISFTARAADKNVNLEWKTASETNNHGFVIERSRVKGLNQESGTGNLGWAEVGFIKGSGTTTEEKFYAFKDRNLNPGYYSYRLIQVDFDGTRTESGNTDVVVNPSPKEYSLEQNYPNPFNPVTTIEYTIPEAELVTIKIFNSNGEEITKIINQYKDAGSYRVNFNAGGLPSGIYFYRIESGSFSTVKKMILLR